MSMERLTYRRRESNETGHKNACDTHRIPDVIDKLAAYEDSEESGELVRVVKCKDCKYFNDICSDCTFCENRKWIGNYDDFPETEPSNFCSYGERKEW